MGFFDLFKDKSVVVPTQRQDEDISFDQDALKAEMIATDPEYRRLHKKLESQDAQLKAILAAEATYKENQDIEQLTLFWEKLWSKGGLKFVGSKWTFRLVDLYYRQQRYDDAFKMLNKFALTRLEYIGNVRKWQIKILKKEKKDYSHIQQLLDNGQ